MAKTSTSWSRSTPGPGRKPGSKNARTKIKELIGIDCPNQMHVLGHYIKGPAVVKLITEMEKLKRKQFVQAYSLVADFIIPKQQRLAVEDDRTPAHTVNNILNVMTIDDKVKLLDILRTSKALELLTLPSNEEAMEDEGEAVSVTTNEG